MGLVALNDKFITTVIDENEQISNSDVRVLRIPASFNFSQRRNLLKDFAMQYNPDVISLQYVPFGYQKKGLPFFLAYRLSKIGKYNWHLMFHELWVGMETNARLKMKIWGYLQRLLIARTIARLKPSVIHTQIPLYHHQLSRLGTNPRLLHLFGNINIPETLTKKVAKDDLNINVLIFGNIHYGAPIEKFADEVYDWCMANGKTCQFFFAGNNGPEYFKWKNVLESRKFETITTGFLDNDELVKLFSKCDIGISSTPQLLLGKSGSVAAMIEFGLPVVCISREWKVNGFEDADCLSNSLVEALHGVHSYRGKINHNNFLEISARFLKDINGQF